MNELIKVDMDTQRVSGRELHEVLQIRTAYKDWFPRMCEYGFVEDVDFSSFLSESTGGRPSMDHQMTIDMAKQICMLQRTDEGKQCRQYFIDLEKAWNTPDQIMARALRIANDKIGSLTHTNSELNKRIEVMHPKALFADAVSTSKTSILVGDLAKIICQNGYEIGQKRLFGWLRDNGYLCKTGNSYNMPTQRYIEQGLFEIKESNVQNPDGSVRVTRTTKVTGKGQVYFVNKFLGTDFT